MKVVRDTLISGKKSSEPPDDLRQDPVLVEILDSLQEMQTFTTALAKGDLTAKLEQSGPLAERLKVLQAQLLIQRDQNDEKISQLKIRLEEEQKQRVQGESTLRDSEEKFRSFVEQSTEGISLADENGRLFVWNRAQEKITGIKAEDALEKYIWEVVPSLFSGEQRNVMEQLAEQDIQRMLEKKDLTITDRLYEVAITRPDGTHRVVESLHLPIYTTKGVLLGNLVWDITEIREMETAMLGTQKMVMLGTLSAGIAHEFNTPLQVITGVSEKMIHSISSRQVSPEEMNKWLEMINDSGWQLAEIVHSLQMCADPTGEEKQNNSLNDLVKDGLLLMQDQLAAWTEISVFVKLDEDLPLLHCNRNQITQAFINLISNAHDALVPPGGEIRVETGYDPHKQGVFLRVADNGTGIPAEVRRRVFDPFFSTKPVGSGTGLGLSLVMAIVQAHQGEIGLDNPPEGGTIITLYFPQKSSRGKIKSSRKTGRFD